MRQWWKRSWPRSPLVVTIRPLIVWLIQFVCMVGAGLLLLGVGINSGFSAPTRDLHDADAIRALKDHQLDSAEKRIELETRLVRIEADSSRIKETLERFERMLFGAIGALFLLVVESIWGMLMMRKHSLPVRQRDQ